MTLARNSKLQTSPHLLFATGFRKITCWGVKLPANQVLYSCFIARSPRCTMQKLNLSLGITRL